MKETYPILKKVPALLPIMWIANCLYLMFFHPRKLLRYMRKIRKVNSNRVEKKRQSLHNVGLDFDDDK